MDGIMFELAVSTDAGVKVDCVLLHILRSLVAWTYGLPSAPPGKTIGQAKDVPSQFPAEIFFSFNTSDEDRYCNTLSVEPLRIIVCRTISALKTIFRSQR